MSERDKWRRVRRLARGSIAASKLGFPILARDLVSAACKLLTEEAKCS